MTSENTSIRGWRKLGLYLQALVGQGFAVIGKDRDKKTVLMRVSLEHYAKGFLGFLPGFRIRIKGTVSLDDLTSAPITAAGAALEAHINNMPGAVKTAVGAPLQISIQSAIGRIKVACNEKIETLLARFSPLLSEFVKADRNSFRQSLLEGLGEKGSEIFASITRRHVHMLITRLKEELGHASQGESQKAGPPALPVGTRFYVQKGNMTVFVVEQPPQTRTLRIMEDNYQKGAFVTLHFPYVIFFIVLRGRKSDDMYVLFSKKPLRSLEDPLFCPATPNIYADFKVCFTPSAAKDTQAEMAEASIASFWGGRFIETHDQGNYAKQISIDNWAKATKKDPLFALSFKWRSANRTVGTLLESIDADFLKVRADQRGTISESRVEKAITELSETTANEIVKELNGLVTKWNLDSIALQKLQSSLEKITVEFAEHAKTALAKEAGGILSEISIRTILETAIQDTIQSTRSSIQGASTAAQTAVKALLEDPQ